MKMGSRLRNLLRREGISAYRLSKITRLDQGYLSKLFQNEFDPGTRSVERILHALGYELVFRRMPGKRQKGGETREQQKDE